jgi:AraC-like DNA-binding protein
MTWSEETWQKATWTMPLNAKPQIVDMGLAVHGLPVEWFRHRGLWAVHFHRYSAELYMAGQLFPVAPSFVTVVAPDTEMEFHFRGRSPHLYILFRLPQTTTDAVRIHAMQEREQDFAVLDATVTEATGHFLTQPRRAEVMLWDILWKLSDTRGVVDASPMRASTHNANQAVDRARHIIEQRLGTALRVPQIAEEVGLSHNHLTRLFRQSLGVTVIGYIEERRAQRAKHLLVYSTRPIKAIAAEVGLADLQTFNKTMRRLTGSSPRRIRQQSA